MSDVRFRLVLVSGALTVGMVEAGLRLAFSWGWPRTLADPGAYSDPLCEDRYWKMRFDAGLSAFEPGAPGSFQHDTRLGWAPDPLRLDAHGAWAAPEGPLRVSEPPVAFFGDSFVQGTVGDADRLPAQLQRMLGDREVWNFGVGGYGLDQILLKVEQTLPTLPEQATALVGVMTMDIDRAVLRVRSAPKPRFTLEDGQLVLDDAHVQQDPSEWLTHNREQVPSFFLAFGWRQLRMLETRLAGELHPECQTEEKHALATALVQRLGEQCLALGHRCRLVLFAPLDRLEDGQDWRAEALLDAAERTGLNPVDTRPMLQKAGGRALYGADRHPSAEGNRVIAEGLTQVLRRRKSHPTPIPRKPNEPVSDP